MRRRLGFLLHRAEFHRSRERAIQIQARRLRRQLDRRRRATSRIVHKPATGELQVSRDCGKQRWRLERERRGY